MRGVFWTIIFVIAVLVIASAVMHNPDATETVQPAEDTVALIDSLQHVTNAMYAEMLKIDELKALAFSLGRSSAANNLMQAADEIYAGINRMYTTHIVPVNQALKGHSIPEASQSALEELQNRAKKAVSIDVKREMALAKQEIGMKVDTDQWKSIVADLAARNDKFDRNMGLRNLADFIAAYDAKLAEEVRSQMDDSFIEQMAQIKADAGDVEVDKMLQSVSEPYLQMELLIAKGESALTNNVVLALGGLLDKFSNPAEKAYAAARIISKLPKISATERQTFYNAVTAVNDNLLQVDCLLGLAESGMLSDNEKMETLHQIEQILPKIEEFHPHEVIMARLVCLKKMDDTDKLLPQIEEIESLTMKYYALKQVAFAHLKDPAEKFDILFAAVDDPQLRLCVLTARFNALGLTGVQAVRYLEQFEGEYLEVKQILPKIKFINAWASVDPKNAFDRVVAIGDMTDKVAAAAAVTKTLNEKEGELAKLLLTDVYAEIMASPQFEPVERSPLIRKLAEAMKAVDTQTAITWLTEAGSPLMTAAQ